MKSIKVVRFNDKREGTSDDEFVYVTFPVGIPLDDAGTIELTYRRERGGLEWKHVSLVKVPAVK